MRNVAVVGALLAAALGGTVLAQPATEKSAAPAATKSQPEPDLLTMYLEREQIKHDRALSLYRIAMESAEKALHEGEWDRAIRFANDALYIIDQNRPSLGVSEVSDMRMRASNVTEKGQLSGAAAKGAKMTAEEMRVEVAAAVKRRELKALRENVAKYKEQHRFIDAIDTLKLILSMEPTDADAKSQLRLLEDTQNFRTFDRLNQVQAQETTKQAIMSKEASIPYADVLSYPEDWVEITRLRQP